VTRRKRREEVAPPPKDARGLLNWQLTHGLTMAKSPITLAEVIDEFIASRKLDKSPRYIVRLMLARRHILKFFPASKNAHTMKPGDIDRYVSKRMRKVANATINQETALLKAAFYLGIQRQKLNHNPLARRRRLPTRKPSEVVRLPVYDDKAALTMISEILAHGAAWLSPIILTLLATSERIGAVLSLRVSDIRENAIHFRPGTLKASPEGRVVFCLGHIAKVLAPLTRGLQSDDFIFWARKEPPGDMPMNADTVRHAWIDAATRAGIVPAPRLHDIRHFCTSTLDRHDVRESIIQSQLGHVTDAMTRHYTHRRVQDTLPAARVLDEMVATVTGETAARKPKRHRIEPPRA
jgi:integrase